ncbi:MAG: hypothetical protein V7L23_37290 [Nostoc sp.]|uniref:hypothetical protein n=1 Tax=Nostoc sp. TaxID=1180 RepID=UPI002FEF880B
MTKRNRPPTAIAEIIEPPKIITSPPEIGYWIDTSRIGLSLVQRFGLPASC